MKFGLIIKIIARHRYLGINSAATRRAGIGVRKKEP